MSALPVLSQRTWLRSQLFPLMHFSHGIRSTPRHRLACFPNGVPCLYVQAVRDPNPLDQCSKGAHRQTLIPLIATNYEHYTLRADMDLYHTRPTPPYTRSFGGDKSPSDCRQRPIPTQQQGQHLRHSAKSLPVERRPLRSSQTCIECPRNRRLRSHLFARRNVHGNCNLTISDYN
jgi:hypothetical protein